MPLKVGDVIERDGATCVWCGRELWPGDLTLEHVVRAPGAGT